MFTGVLGGVLTSLVLTRYPAKMMVAAYAITIAAIATLGYFLVADKLADKTQILIACGVVGFTLLPILMVAYELAVAQTAQFGVGESMSCGLINLYANAMGFFIAIALTPALAQETKASTDVTITVLFANLVLSLAFLLIASLCFNSKEK